MWVGLGVAVAAALAFYAWPPFPSLLNLLFDVLAFAFMLFASLVVISQFVLPVQTPAERRNVVDHFMHYVSGSAGPILLVKDGKVVGRAQEMKRYGHGVALVDAVSAVVLEQAAARPGWLAPVSLDGGRARNSAAAAAKGPPLVRAHGPGIVFIRPGERLVSTLDLRRQSRGTAVKV
jgi:hypothetical protein